MHQGRWQAPQQCWVKVSVRRVRKMYYRSASTLAGMCTFRWLSGAAAARQAAWE